MSGAGKTPSGRTHFCSVDSDLVAYGVGSHRHYPEIAAGLAAAATGVNAFGASPVAPPAAPPLTFVPHLVPLQRGISETIYVRSGTLPLPSAAAVGRLFDEFYADEPFVEVCDAPPQLKDVSGTNFCRLFPTVDERAGRIVVISVHRQPDEGRLGAGRAEHERHARPARAARGWSRCCRCLASRPCPAAGPSRGGGVTCPEGFVAAGVASGVKKRGKLDLGILLAAATPGSRRPRSPATPRPPRPCASRARAASACDGSAVVVNAGNANACTGKQGLADAARMRVLAAEQLRLPVEHVAVASTGVIGVALADGTHRAGIAAAAASRVGARRRATSRAPSARPTARPSAAPSSWSCPRASCASAWPPRAAA